MDFVGYCYICFEVKHLEYFPDCTCVEERVCSDCIDILYANFYTTSDTRLACPFCQQEVHRINLTSLSHFDSLLTPHDSPYRSPVPRTTPVSQVNVTPVQTPFERTETPFIESNVTILQSSEGEVEIDSFGTYIQTTPSPVVIREERKRKRSEGVVTRSIARRKLNFD